MNTRFTVANHALALLAEYPDELITSERIASSVNTNPVVIRRVLGTLARGHLVIAQAATGGGWRLARPANMITLLDVYRAIVEEDPFPLHHQPPNPQCRIGRNIQHALEGIYGAAQSALEQELGQVTVADLLARVLESAPSSAR